MVVEKHSSPIDNATNTNKIAWDLNGKCLLVLDIPRTYDLQAEKRLHKMFNTRIRRVGMPDELMESESLKMDSRPSAVLVVDFAKQIKRMERVNCIVVSMQSSDLMKLAA